MHNLTNEWVSVQSFGVNQFTVYNTTFGKSFTDNNRVNVLKCVLLGFGIEPVLFDELCDASLHLCP